MNRELTMLMILDGYGMGKENEKDNAIEKQGSKNIKNLMNKYPSSQLSASGLDVGLPEGQMGNSEVGHLNIGSGRIVYQELTRITKEIKDGDFFKNKELIKAMENAKSNNKKLHVSGLLSDGGVHSHIDHLKALILMAKNYGLKDIYIHAVLDGRDVSPTSGANYIKEIYQYTNELQFGKIASVVGRYYLMDRDNRWDRVEKGYRLLTKGEGQKVTCPFDAVEKSYTEGVTDEFILPLSVVGENGEGVKVENGDSFIFFNFRPDRAREITRALTNDNFNEFEAEELNLTYVGFTKYDSSFTKCSIAFTSQILSNTLGEYLSKQNKTQLRIAETEKYAHVTFFFNGGVEEPNPNEDRILIPSPKVATYDLKPEMSAYEVKDAVIKEIRQQKYDCIILNFANCDMVGHTGIIESAMKAVEAVDNCVKEIAEEVLKVNGHLLITADHGNAEQMEAEDGSPFTAHTSNPVPFVLVSNKYENVQLEKGILADIAPTMLELMSIEKPKEMEGKSLIKK